MITLEDKIKALLESKQDEAVSEAELIESVVELDAEGNEIVEATLDSYPLEEIEEYMQSEDFQQLDELSKVTLGHYVKKASTNVNDLGIKLGGLDSSDKSNQQKRSDLGDKQGSRVNGIRKAMRKMDFMKEAVTTIPDTIAASPANEGPAADNAKINAGKSKKLEVDKNTGEPSTVEPNNAKNNVEKNMVAEHVAALLTGEELSEDFKAKAAVIFEAAVSEVVEARLLALEEEHAQKLDEAVTAMKAELVENIDGFLDEIVEGWMEENKLAVERGIKVDIVENFIDGMKDLFKEHYIEVPEEKVNILDEQAETIETLQAALTTASEQIATLSEEVSTSKKALVIESVGEYLSDTDFEKFTNLCENIEYSELFESKAKTIRESYFPKAKQSNDDEKTVTVSVESGIDMDRYVKALASQASFS